MGGSAKGPGDERELTTGDLARGVGTTLRAVRFYEEAGLLRPSRTAGGRRVYTGADLEKLQLITDLRELDLSIDEIKRLLEIREGCADAPELATRFTEVLTEQLERTQRRLQALRRLREEFAATLELLRECGTCRTPLMENACRSCDVVDDAPRLLKIVVGHDGEGEVAPPEDRVTPVRTPSPRALDETKGD